ncbi:S8 family serine peptidase [Novosphingobium jiangmenense]|uniref:S8 family serine peptidase n=1 Tax=Novosphingobium jiangmenense TaxID=2791981 RepID=A0ABS0HLI6_9SPHN|nr:S8 family serine peptidase [Novosphingobium jiangmenense]MBF9153104.1 S8 family serine peptidase [Novosphingobium jiangmenense]
MKRLALSALLLCTVASPLAAQLALPPLREGIGRTLEGVGATLPPPGETLDGLSATVRTLAQARLERIERIARANRTAIDRDASGDLARRGELLMLDPSAAAIATAAQAGFEILSKERLDNCDMTVVRFGVPEGMSLAKAQALLQAQLPDATISADTLNFASGQASAARSVKVPAGSAMPAIDMAVGVIDGGAAGADEARGFAKGAPRAGDHGTAVVSLLRYAGVRRVVVADVYGSDPAGGNALAVARALDWLLTREIRVASISLVGPANPVLAKAIMAAQRKGMVIVAAVGNDGPAAPPVFPASYSGVIAVTAVDGRNRPLIEAGRALHLDYAAPGADLYASNAAGRRVKVRGTSFATPLVASRAALALARGGEVKARLDGEAIDLGPRGADRTFGRGLLCTLCRPGR